MIKFVFVSFVIWTIPHLSNAQNPDSLLAQGKALYSKNQIDTVTVFRLYKSAQDKYLAQKKYDGYVQSTMCIGAVYDNEGIDYQRAIREYRRGEKYFGRISLPTHFNANLMLAGALQRAEKLAESEQYFLKNEDLLSKNKGLISRLDPQFLFAFYGRYGKLAEVLGDYQRALILYEKMLCLSENPALNEMLNYGLTYKANLHTARGEYAKAVELFERAKPISFYTIDLSEIYAYKANCYLKMKQLDKAESEINKAFELFRKSKQNNQEVINKSYEKNLYLIFAKLQKALNKPQQAKEAFLKVLALGQYKNTALSAEAFLGLGELSENKSKQEAKNYYQKAIEAVWLNAKKENFRDILSSKECFVALRHKANAEDGTQAIKTFRLAIKLAEKIRIGYESADAKLFFSEEIRPIYAEALEAVWKYSAQKEKDAFEFIEKSKESVLADALRENEIRPKTIDAAKILEEQSLRRQITQNRLLLSQEPSDSLAKVNLLNAEMSQIRLIKSFEEHNQAYFRLKYQSAVMPLAAFQQALDPQTLWVSYLEGKDFLYVLAIGNSQQKFCEIAKTQLFETHLQQLLLAVNTRPGMKIYQGTASSKYVYQHLISPIASLFSSKTRLVFSKDGLLHYLPFDVLEKEGTKDFLIKKYAVSYAHTATMLLEKTSANPKASNILAFAPFTKEVPETTSNDSSLNFLPASEIEVNTIGGRIYTGNLATKNQFLEQYRSHGILHFATHAQIDDQNPDRSFIAFYPDSTHFRLYTNELYDLSLQNSRLVVLSACQSGKGRLAKGEGLLSLARAFLYAGCPSVVASLWNANDRSTAYISTRFHENLQKHQSLDLALQNAKLNYFSSEIGQELDHPYYWSHLVLIGYREGFEAGYTAYLLALGLVIIFVLCVLYWKKLSELDSQTNDDEYPDL